MTQSQKMKISPIFTWERFWIGVRLDRARCRVIFFPVPMLGIVIQFGECHDR